jgi:coenzyme F420 hydrogenase subunit beta
MSSKVKSGSQGLLKKHVLEEGLCTGCGACANLCPYQVVYHDRTVHLHHCDLKDGKCYAYCPRTTTDMAALRKLFFEQADLTPEIGAVKAYYFSQAIDPGLRGVSQHGATVTALLEFAIAQGLINSAVVSARDREFMQNGELANGKIGTRKNAGSRFTVSPVVAAFNQLVTKDAGNVGVVATPCQALALAKMKFVGKDDRADKINQLKLVIGLYCGWTLSEEKYKRLLAENNISPELITKTDIPAGQDTLEVHTENSVKSIGLNEVRKCIRDACLYCLDSTAEFADISVGSARFDDDWEKVRKWNQLIVRTEKGGELIDLAVKKGVLELREAPAESLKELKKAAVKKKKIALRNIVQMSGSMKNLLYLDRRDPVVLKYLTKEISGRKRR